MVKAIFGDGKNFWSIKVCNFGKIHFFPVLSIVETSCSVSEDPSKLPLT